MVCTRNFFKKEELGGQLGIFGPLCQEAGIQERCCCSGTLTTALGELGPTGNLCLVSQVIS